MNWQDPKLQQLIVDLVLAIMALAGFLLGGVKLSAVKRQNAELKAELALVKQRLTNVERVPVRNPPQALQ